MRRDASEIIEVFDTDGPLVGNGFDATRLGESEFRGAPGDDDDAGVGPERDGDGVRRRRWVIPAGVTALVAVVAVGITTGSHDQNAATSTSSGDSIAASPITLATLPPTTVAITDSVPSADGGLTPPVAPAPDGDVPRYVVDVPQGYTVFDASVVEIGMAPVTYSQLWASSDATRRSGTWVGITESPAIPDDGRAAQLQNDAYTTRLGDTTAIITVPTTSGDTITVSLYRERSIVVVEGFGLTIDALTEIATSLGTGPTSPTGPPADLPVLAGLQKQIDGTTFWGRTNRAGQMAQLYAIGAQTDPASGRNASLLVTVAPPSPGFATAAPFLFDSLTPFTASDGSIGLAGFQPQGGADEQRIATAYWIDPAGWAVQIVAESTIADVIALARTAHVADDVEWNGLTAGTPPPPPQADLSFDEATMPSLTFGDGSTADISLDVLRSPSSTSCNWAVITSNPAQPNENGYGGTPTGSVDQASVSVLASLDRTFVLANVPAGTTGATLTVYPAGGSPISTPLAELRPAFPVLGAVLTFEQVGAFTAVLTAADGTVLASWPPAPAPPAGNG